MTASVESSLEVLPKGVQREMWGPKTTSAVVLVWEILQCVCAMTGVIQGREGKSEVMSSHRNKRMGFPVLWGLSWQHAHLPLRNRRKEEDKVPKPAMRREVCETT